MDRVEDKFRYCERISKEAFKKCSKIRYYFKLEKLWLGGCRWIIFIQFLKFEEIKNLILNGEELPMFTLEILEFLEYNTFFFVFDSLSKWTNWRYWYFDYK